MTVFLCMCIAYLNNSVYHCIWLIARLLASKCVLTELIATVSIRYSPSSLNFNSSFCSIFTFKAEKHCEHNRANAKFREVWYRKITSADRCWYVFYNDFIVVSWRLIFAYIFLAKFRVDLYTTWALIYFESTNHFQNHYEYC